MYATTDKARPRRNSHLLTSYGSDPEWQLWSGWGSFISVGDLAARQDGCELKVVLALLAAERQSRGADTPVTSTCENAGNRVSAGRGRTPEPGLHRTFQGRSCGTGICAQVRDVQRRLWGM